MVGNACPHLRAAFVVRCGVFLLYSFCEATMFANALRGLGWAGLSAAGYSMLALSAPAERRGEASGYYSGVQASGTILLPAVALWLIYAPFGGFRTVFVVAIALAAIGAGTGALLARHAPQPTHNRHTVSSAPWWREILNVLDREIILASVLSFGSHVTSGGGEFLVLYEGNSHRNIGWFYVASGHEPLLARC
jgi:MFS family permease